MFLLLQNGDRLLLQSGDALFLQAASGAVEIGGTEEIYTPGIESVRERQRSLAFKEDDDFYLLLKAVYLKAA